MNRLLGAEPTSTHAFQVIHRSFAFGHRHLCTALWEWVEPDITHGNPKLSRQRVDHSEVYSDTVAVTGGTQAECNVDYRGAADSMANHSSPRHIHILFGLFNKRMRDEVCAAVGHGLSRF